MCVAHYLFKKTDNNVKEVFYFQNEIFLNNCIVYSKFACAFKVKTQLIYLDFLNKFFFYKNLFSLNQIWKHKFYQLGNILLH